MRLTVLGSGTSFGVPVIGCDCQVCTSSDPRDRRTRTAAVIENDAGKRILIDTPPELRLQLVASGIDGVNAVLYTHGHADHVHGIDDLRAVSVKRGSLSLLGPEWTLKEIEGRFRYIFDPSVQPARDTSKPDLELRPLAPWDEVEIAGMLVTPVEVDHGGTAVFGYRVGDVGYVTDAKSVSDRAVDVLCGVKVLILNALLERPHATHLSIDEAIGIAKRVGAPQTYFTHLTHKFSHEDLEQRLPEGISPAYDGLTIAF